MTPCSLNWYAGWGLILVGFLTGAGLGLSFHRDDFLGGYGSFRRRVLRLGHIACIALGMLNLLYALAVQPAAAGPAARLASVAWVVGGVAMPVTCFLTGWRTAFRRCFPVPVIALLVAVTATLVGGLPCA
jgi:hypothetical protein